MFAISFAYLLLYILFSTEAPRASLELSCGALGGIFYIYFDSGAPNVYLFVKNVFPSEYRQAANSKTAIDRAARVSGADERTNKTIYYFPVEGLAVKLVLINITCKL